MKTTSPKGFLNFMYWFFRITFWLQLVGVSLFIVFNYFMYDSKQGFYFTVRGNIYASETLLKSCKDSVILDSLDKTKFHRNQNGVITLDKIDNKTIYYMNGNRIGFMRIDYSNFSKAFTFKNIAWVLCDILIMLLWLLISYQIMKILQSLRNKSIFNQQNTKRIRFIGWLFILIPFAEFARDQLFFLVVSQHIKIKGIDFVSNSHWYDLSPFSIYGSASYGSMNHPLFPSIALGLIILVIAQIFKNGLDLQKENDLTI